MSFSHPFSVKHSLWLTSIYWIGLAAFWGIIAILFLLKERLTKRWEDLVVLRSVGGANGRGVLESLAKFDNENREDVEFSWTVREGSEF